MTTIRIRDGWERYALWGLAIVALGVMLLSIGCGTPQASTTVTPGEASAKSVTTTSRLSIQTPEVRPAPVIRLRIVPPPVCPEKETFQ